MSKLSVIVLAAGLGTRMKSNTPKHLHKVGGLEIIQHIIKTAEDLNAEEIVIVCNQDNIDYIKSNKVKKVIQIDKKGTAHATQIGFDNIENKNNDILVMYGDTPFVKSKTYQKLVDKLNEKEVKQVGAVFRTLDVKNRYGRVTVQDDCLIKNVEFKDCSEEERKNDLCNGAILAIKGEVLSDYLKKIDNNNVAKEYYLTDTINIGNRESALSKYVIIEENEIQGVNSREDLSKAETIFQNEKRSWFMANGVTLIDPSTVYFSYDTEIENDVIIEPNVFISTGVKIKNGAHIKSFSYLEGCSLEENVSIGPFARIRPITTIKSNCHVGNFVEIKNSVLNSGVKSGHLTYLGDAVIGENTNIGAGSITCNYDGYTKSKIEIGSDCFIGSNTIIIAPNKIGNNAMVAAGSVITKNIDNNEIAIARVEQTKLKETMDEYRKRKEKKM